MPLHGSLKKGGENNTTSPRPNRTSCLRNRHISNKDRDTNTESRSGSPSNVPSPYSSRRSSCEEVVVFPTDKKEVPSEKPECSTGRTFKDNNMNNISTPKKSGTGRGMDKEKRLIIVVDDTRFHVDRNLFSSYPDTMLAKMFSMCMIDERGWTKPNECGEYEISHLVSAYVFKALLEYYTSGVVTCPPGVSVRDLKSACEYFLIPFNHSTIKCNNLGSFMHEIANDGARQQFIHFLDVDILPLMVKVAQRGDRECHIMVMSEEDTVEWNAEYPPQMGEEYTELVHSTALHRFLRYIENREVAKSVLKDRGMKKIKLGIEGYPISVDHVKRRGSGRQEVIYDYVQRSSIAMSWEKEESRSRHVDFQCVTKSKSITDLIAAAADTPQDQGLIIQAEDELNGLHNVNLDPDEINND